MKMSTKQKLNRFLKALDAAKQDYTCGYCKEMCVNPAVLSSCFHIICSEHFPSLNLCPTCGIPLLNCSLYVDEQLENCIQSTKQLDNMFQAIKSGSSQSNTRQSKENVSRSEISEENNENKTNKIEVRKNVSRQNSKTDVNMSLLSTVSSSKGKEKKNTKGETCLHVACRQGKISTVMDLLNTGANTNTKDHAGWTPLHEVVQSGRLDMVKLLLQHNTLINVPGPSNETPLHEAVRYKHKDIAAELVRNGANIDARNNKSETPLQLASEEMKIVLLEAKEDVQQTQGNNVIHIADMQAELDFEDIRLYSASNCRSIANKLKLLEKKHDNLHLEAKFTKKVNVLVVDTEENGTCVSSVDVLQGIVYEIWILSSQWVTKSTQERLEPLKDYEVKGIGHHNSNGPKNARYNKYKQLPGLFDGCHFYLHNFVTKYEISKTLVLTKQILTKLITDADGVVLRRVPNPELIPDAEKVVPSHAKEGGKLETCSHYIIFKDKYEPMYNMSHIKALPLGWLIDCIEKYELCDP